MEESVGKHTLTISNREHLEISGVEDVESFEDDTVVIYTTEGMLTLKGNDFKINKLNVENGEMIIDGYCESVLYSNSGRKDKAGFLSKIFG